MTRGRKGGDEDRQGGGETPTPEPSRRQPQDAECRSSGPPSGLYSLPLGKI